MRKIETHDLVDPFDADIEATVVAARKRLGVEPVTEGERLAVGPDNGRHLGVRDAGGTAVAIDDATCEPGALIGDAEEVRAIRAHVNGGDAAEGLGGRGERQPAAEFKSTEARFRRVARVEALDRRRFNRDLGRCAGITHRLSQRERADGEGERDGECAGDQPAGAR